MVVQTSRLVCLALSIPCATAAAQGSARCCAYDLVLDDNGVIAPWYDGVGLVQSHEGDGGVP